PEERPTAGDIAILLQTLDISTSELRARDPVSNEGSELNVISYNNSSKISFSWTPLVRAIFDGDIKTVKRHLSKKGKKSTGDDIALILAAKVGHAEIVELLDPTDWDGVTALMRAAEKGDVEAVRALIPLQKGRQTLRKVNINGVWIFRRGTALMRAASCGHAEVVRLLVEHEGGMQDSWDWSALMHAAEKGHANCVELLAEKEGGMQESDGKTALMNAARNGHAEVVNLLAEKEEGMQDKDGVTALMCATYNNRLECAKLFLEKEGGMQDKDGWTALMYATYSNNLECVRLLAEREKDMKTTRKWFGYLPGTTALDIAKKMGRTEIVSILKN
ncbi:Ankyrin repeat protein, partial [Giardia duodenalis]